MIMGPPWRFTSAEAVGVGEGHSSFDILWGLAPTAVSEVAPAGSFDLPSFCLLSPVGGSETRLASL